MNFHSQMLFLWLFMPFISLLSLGMPCLCHDFTQEFYVKLVFLMNTYLVQPFNSKIQFVWEFFGFQFGAKLALFLDLVNAVRSIRFNITRAILYLQTSKATEDTTAMDVKNGKDIQGIPWERMNTTRDSYRQARMQQYANFENIPNSGRTSEKVWHTYTF